MGLFLNSANSAQIFQNSLNFTQVSQFQHYLYPNVHRNSPSFGFQSPCFQNFNNIFFYNWFYTDLVIIHYLLIYWFDLFYYYLIVLKFHTGFILIDFTFRLLRFLYFLPIIFYSKFCDLDITKLFWFYLVIIICIKNRV